MDLKKRRCIFANFQEAFHSYPWCLNKWSDLRYHCWAKPFVICNDLDYVYVKTLKEGLCKNTKLKNLMSKEKNAIIQECNFSRLVCVCDESTAASTSDWNEPLETDLFNSFGWQLPSSAKDFPLFLVRALWEAARWSCWWNFLPSTFNKNVQII